MTLIYFVQCITQFSQSEAINIYLLVLLVKIVITQDKFKLTKAFLVELNLKPYQKFVLYFTEKEKNTIYDSDYKLTMNRSNNKAVLNRNGAKIVGKITETDISWYVLHYKPFVTYRIKFYQMNVIDLLR